MAKNVVDVYPLSPIQQGLLFEQMYRPGTGIYIEHLLITFHGDLRPAVFERAWQLVVDRHPILRTTFHWQKDGRVRQVVHRQARLALETLDWTSLGESEQDVRLKKTLAAERLAGFPLERAPLMRATVVRRGDERWTFAWRFSHLLMDGWSFGLAVEEFTECYRALCQGREPDLAPAPPYRDYLRWWAEHDATEHAEYWTRELAGFVPPDPLSIEGEPLPEGTATHDFLELELAELGPGLRALSRRHQLTLNTVVQGAWLVLLSRYYGTDDVICGATIAHRPGDLASAPSILGPMIVTLPVRERLEQTRAVLPWLQDFQRHLAAVRERTSLPLVELQKSAGGGADLPLLESSVSFENVPMPELALEAVGLEVTEIFYDGRPHYPITMVIMPGDHLPLRIVFDRRRFSRPAATRIARQLTHLLGQIAERPEATLGELDLDGASPTPGRADLTEGEPRTLAESFAHWVRRSPQATALVFGGDRLTYAALDERAERIAAPLRDLGIGPGSRVGLLMETGPDLVAAMIAVFRAGAAYVPLDPVQPEARLRELISDARLGALLAEPASADRLPEGSPPLLVLESGAAPVLPLRGVTPRADAPAVPTGDDPAYVLYTSGSTGRPKAVVVTHRNVQSLLAAGRAEFGFGPGHTWTFAHSYVFDYSVWEIWGALANGGRLVVVPRWTARSPHELSRLVVDQRVSVLSLTPMVFEHVARELLDESGAHALEHVFLGGDRLDPSVLRPWTDRHGTTRPRLHNLYGLTEAAVVSTHHRVTEADLARDEPVPIGRALPNQHASVLDPSGRPVPVGATGELHVGGPAVALGYFDRHDLTAERFGTAPGSPGTRTYRTGDLVRRREDGVLEFLGRVDNQVKLRGFRVEPDEVAAVLRRHPDVRAAAVVLQHDLQHADDGPRLAAHLVAHDEPVPEEAMREWAAAHLPEYMIPAAVGWLDDLPTNSSGKLDTRALPALSKTSAPNGAFAPPRTAAEKDLAAYLEDLLGADGIGRDDRLDTLGLHSLHAMRLAAWLRARYGVSVALRTLLASPTIASMARAVDTERSTPA